MSTSVHTAIARPLVLVVLLVGAFSASARGQVSIRVEPDEVVLENAAVRHVISVPRNEPGAVRPASFRDLRLDAESLDALADAAWFEFSVNGSPVSAIDPIWRVEDVRTRDLRHEGKEVELVLRAAKGPARGLIVTAALQVFPRSTLIRQQLRLTGNGHRLTHQNGNVHLIYPSYTLAASPADELRSREIRIATWNAELLPNAPQNTSPDERDLVEGWRAGRDLSRNYMYHPVRIDRALRGNALREVKGPIVLTSNQSEGQGWVTLYEHGSPDNDSEQEYFSIQQVRTDGDLEVSIRARKGAYFHGEQLSEVDPFATVWTAVGPVQGSVFDAGEAAVWDYLLYSINDQFASRRPFLYYNTWGMQREAQNRGEDPRAILTIDRVLEELSYADQLGIDLFVLDDGWQIRFGDWVPDPAKYPDGLAPLRQALADRDVIFGIWLATLATDPDSDVATEHPDWLIRDDAGEPVIGNWDRQVFCFVSDYRDHYVARSKWLIDQGVRYFKWDGIDKHLCNSPLHRHGDASVPPEERKARYGYELSRYLTDAARELTEYEPEVVIEFDITEPERSVGLEFLSEGRYFWMNNGASWYGDLSTYRMKSMRMVPALFHGIIPPVLQTAANYPHDDPTFRAQRYAINTSLLGGRGFWGDLSEMSEEERLRVGAHVEDAKRVLDTSARVRPHVSGAVGASPEIYTFVDPTSGEGQVIGFSGSAIRHRSPVRGVAADHVLAVLRNAYHTKGDELQIDFVFPHADASREAILISNGGSGVRIRSSSSWLEDVIWNGSNELRFANGAPGVHEVVWPFDSEPDVSVPEGVTVEASPSGGKGFILTFQTTAAGQWVTLRDR